jgi:hypothetical protein
MVDSIIMMDQQWKGSRAIGIFLWLVENAKEGWTKVTTYKVSEGIWEREIVETH